MLLEAIEMNGIKSKNSDLLKAFTRYLAIDVNMQTISNFDLSVKIDDRINTLIGSRYNNIWSVVMEFCELLGRKDLKANHEAIKFLLDNRQQLLALQSGSNTSKLHSNAWFLLLLLAPLATMSLDVFAETMTNTSEETSSMTAIMIVFALALGGALIAFMMKKENKSVPEQQEISLPCKDVAKFIEILEWVYKLKTV